MNKDIAQLPKSALTPGARLTQLGAERPHEIALICERSEGGDESLTRLDLEQWANRLAHRLAELYVGPGSFVAISVPNGLDHIVATLATYKLGGCPMPISYRMPPAERDAMMALAAPKAVVSDAPELGGITRAVLLEDIRVAGFSIGEKTLMPADLESADEIFITSTTRELLPVASVEGLQLRATDHSVRARLQQAFSAHVRAYTAARLPKVAAR